MRRPACRILCFITGCVLVGAATWGQTDTLHLTWQGDPATTMTVQWVEQGEVPAVVRGVAAEDATIDLPRVTDAEDASAWDGADIHNGGAYFPNLVNCQPQVVPVQFISNPGIHAGGSIGLGAQPCYGSSPSPPSYIGYRPRPRIPAARLVGN
jgi:hypothetical protein